MKNFMLFVFIAGFLPLSNIQGQGLTTNGPCPEGELVDPTMAFDRPDEFAWRLFVNLNQPGDPITRCRDTTRTFGDEGPVVWETWKNARVESGEIFKVDASDPGDWRSDLPGIDVASDANGSVAAIKQFSSFRAINAKQAVVVNPEDFRGATPVRALFDSEITDVTGNEVRYNRPSYIFTRENGFYSADKQTEVANQNIRNLEFPVAAKVIKAQWRLIPEDQKPRYHWAVINKIGQPREIWGLTALHISTKDLPNWFWTTFEHVDNKLIGDPFGIWENQRAHNVGWQTSSIDAFACPGAPTDCDTVPAGLGIEGTKWENYRNRGSQIDFTNPLILANSQIEAPFQSSSSCISCHALAARRKDGTAAGFGISVGPIDFRLTDDPVTGLPTQMMTDFLFTYTFQAR